MLEKKKKTPEKQIKLNTKKYLNQEKSIVTKTFASQILYNIFIFQFYITIHENDLDGDLPL